MLLPAVPAGGGAGGVGAQGDGDDGLPGIQERVQVLEGTPRSDSPGGGGGGSGGSGDGGSAARKMSGMVVCTPLQRAHIERHISIRAVTVSPNGRAASPLTPELPESSVRIMI